MIKQSALKRRIITNNIYKWLCVKIQLEFVFGYDATLQGGLFNHKSVYTLNDSEIERFTLQNNFGLVLQYHALYLEYSRTILTREFSYGSSFKWGGIRIGFKL